MLGWSLSIPGAILQRFLSQQLKKKAELLELSSSLPGSDVGRFQDSWRWPAKISSDDSSRETLSLTCSKNLLSWWNCLFRTSAVSVSVSGLGWAGLLLQGDGLLAPAALSSSGLQQQNHQNKVEAAEKSDSIAISFCIQHYLFCSWSWLPSLLLLQSFRTFSQSLGWAGIPPWGDDLQKDRLTLKLNWVKIPSKTREKRPTLELNWVKISIGDQVRLCYACIA